MIRKILIAIALFTGLALVAGLIWAVSLVNAFGGFDKDYSVTDLKKHFSEKEKEIRILKQYFRTVTPDHTFIEIEFDGNRSLFRFGYELPDGTRFLDWDLHTHTERMDSLIRPLGWTRATLQQIKTHLDNAGCIKIESGEPGSIGFQRSGMGMYSFIVFDQPVPDSLKRRYNDSCACILVAERLALGYGGGAIGSQCFYNLE